MQPASHQPARQGSMGRVAFLITILLGGVSVAEEPGWWRQAHRDDALYLYVKGCAAGCPDEAAANTNAFLHAVWLLQHRISTRAGVELRGVEPFYTEAARQDDGWSAWCLARLPRDANATLLQTLQENETRLENARQLVANRRYAEARAELERLLVAYPVGWQSLFDSEAAAALLAEVCQFLQDRPAAYDALEKISVQSDLSDWRGRAERALQALGEISEEEKANRPVRRWCGGKTTAVLAVQSLSGAASAPWQEMVDRLRALLQAQGGRCSGLAATNANSARWLQADGWIATDELRPCLGEADNLLLCSASGRLIRVGNKHAFEGMVRVTLLARSGQRQDFSSYLIPPRTDNPSLCMDDTAYETINLWRRALPPTSGLVP